MLKIICLLLFILYNYLAFKYSSKVFLIDKTRYKYFYFVMTLNSSLLALVLLFDIIIYESILMIIFPIILYFQFKLVFKDGTIKNIFGVLSFSINFFSIRIITVNILSIVSELPIYNIVNSFKGLVIVSIITLIISSIYLIILIFIMSIKYVNLMYTDKENLKFSISILVVIYVYLVVNSNLLYIQYYHLIINIMYIKIGICAIIGFLVALTYCYLFSRLQLYVVKAENIEREIQEEEIALKQLENEANYDYFTSCLKRDVIYKKIDDILESMPFFSIAFIDIDGLKITNDEYGHDEGDFYIKAVAEILNSEFIGKAIGRIGGDEFLVVLEHTDIYATMKCVVRCFERVENISKMFNKPYSTSISYGVVEITPDTKLSRDDIIKQADIKMYKFKKSRKKNRK